MKDTPQEHYFVIIEPSSKIANYNIVIIYIIKIIKKF